MPGWRLSHSAARSNTKDASSGLDTLPPSWERSSSNPQPAVSTTTQGLSPSKVRAATSGCAFNWPSYNFKLPNDMIASCIRCCTCSKWVWSGWRSTKRSIMVVANTCAPWLFTVGGNWHGSPESTKRVARLIGINVAGGRAWAASSTTATSNVTPRNRRSSHPTNVAHTTSASRMTFSAK